jgi:hypothetical protein
MPKRLKTAIFPQLAGDHDGGEDADVAFPNGVKRGEVLLPCEAAACSPASAALQTILLDL